MSGKRGRRLRWPKIGRDTVLVVVGMTGFLHEVFLSAGDRYSIIAGSLALMGLPVYLRADERREAHDDKERPERSEP